MLALITWRNVPKGTGVFASSNGRLTASAMSAFNEPELEAVVAEVLRKEPISRVVVTIFCNVYHMVHQNYQHCFEERFQLVLNNR